MFTSESNLGAAPFPVWFEVVQVLLILTVFLCLEYSWKVMSAIDLWNAPQWADFTASPMANLDDYFNTRQSEGTFTSGKDSLSGTISEDLQEISTPDNPPEEEASKNLIVVETNDKSASSEKPLQNKTDFPDPVKEKKPDIKNDKTNKGRLRPRVLTSNIRRHSVTKYRRRSDQYVPLAEALRKFQNGTPTRFRSNKSKDKNAAPPKQVRQTKPQLTHAMSPLLRCKSRTRAASTASQKSELATKSIAASSKLSSALLKKPTNIKPLKKSEKIPSESSSEPKVSMCAPKARAIIKDTDKTLNLPSSSNDMSSLSSSVLSKSLRAHNTPRKKMAPTVVTTDEGMKIKEVEVLHFGIPVSNVNKKITRPKPFSFETRTKELLTKKNNLKAQQEDANKTKKTTFHAKAVPASSVVKKTTSVLKPKENNADKANPTTRMLTFKERNDLAIKKKKELMDQMYEKEKKARVFHAKPAPTFKPVFVRGNSAENLRISEKNKAKARGISPASRQRGYSQGSIVAGNEENEAPNISNYGCPKLKNPLITEKQKFKRTVK